MVLVALDTGTLKSAVIAVDIQTYEILDVSIMSNEDALTAIRSGYYDYLTIEGITSYGQPIGQETLDTVFLNGRLYQIGLDREVIAEIIPRKDIKTHFEVPRGIKVDGHMQKVNADAFIRRTLIDRFAKFDKKNGKGTIKNKDVFWGLTSDMWSAFALAVTFIDNQKRDI